MKEVPFDFTHLRHIEYRNSVSGSDELKEKLKAAIGEFKPNPYTLTKIASVKGSRMTNKIIGSKGIFKKR